MTSLKPCSPKRKAAQPAKIADADRLLIQRARTAAKLDRSISTIQRMEKAGLLRVAPKRKPTDPTYHYMSDVLALAGLDAEMK